MLSGLFEKKNRKGTRYFEDGDGEIIAKECRKCSEIKELAEFSRHKRQLGGREAACKACTAEYHAEWREANKERIAERMAEWREANKEYYAEYYAANKERIAEYHAEWREANKEWIAEYNAEWREANKEYQAEYREANKERLAEQKAAWSRNNPDKVRLKDQRRRARKKALPDTLTAAQYAETMLFFGSACALTGETTDLHQEHAIPLSIGHGGTIRENVYPMVGRLNISKGDRNIFEWFEANAERFGLSQDRFDRLIDFLANANDMSAEEYREYVDYCHANINVELAQ